MKKTICLMILLVLIISSLCVTLAVPNDNVEDELDGEEGIMPINMDYSNESKIMPRSTNYSDEDGIMPLDMDYFDNNSYGDLNEDNYYGIFFGKDDLYALEDNVTYNEIRLDGNAYIFGENAYLKDCTIKGNVFIFAENINMDNVLIEGSLYLCANTAELNVYAQDVYVAANKVKFNGLTSISRTLKLGANEATLSGRIGKSCYLAINELTLDDNCKISGNLEYRSTKEANIKKENVLGDIKYHKIEKDKDEETTAKSFISAKIRKLVSTAITTFTIGGLVLLVLGKVNKKKEEVAANLMVSFGIGLISLILIPLLSILLICTLLGAGIGVLLFILYFIILFTSTAIVSIKVALMIYSKKEEEKSNWYILGIAILIAEIITLVSFIPVLNVIIGLLVSLTGLGVVVKSIFSKKSNNKNKEEVVVKEV